MSKTDTAVCPEGFRSHFGKNPNFFVQRPFYKWSNSGGLGSLGWAGPHGAEGPGRLKPQTPWSCTQTIRPKGFTLDRVARARDLLEASWQGDRLPHKHSAESCIWTCNCTATVWAAAPPWPPTSFSLLYNSHEPPHGDESKVPARELQNSCSAPSLCKIVPCGSWGSAQVERWNSSINTNTDTGTDTLCGSASDFIGSPVKDRADLIFLFPLFASLCAYLCFSTSLHPYSNSPFIALLAALRLSTLWPWAASCTPREEREGGGDFN